MLFKNYDLKESYIFYLILIFYFLFNIYQINFQHWSSMMDHDFYIIYNSLLISSGLEQEGRDHPAFTTFLLHGIIFKIVSIFQSSIPSNINEILNSNNIDNSLQFYFSISRITNFFINALLFLSFYKLIQLLNINKKIILFTSLVFLSSNWFFLSFFSLRSENLSLLFTIISIIFLIKNEKIELKNYFFSGIFFMFAIFTKIQIIFFILYLIFLIGTTIKDEKRIKNNYLFFKFNLNYLLFSLIFLIFCYLVYQLKIQEFPRFERNKYLDLFVFFVALIFISFYFFMTSNYKLHLVREKLILLSAILHGFVFCFLILVLLDFIKVLNINDFIYLRVLNPIHYMSEFQAHYAEGLINTKFIFSTIYEIFTGYDQSYFELILLLILIILARKFYIDNNKFNFFNLLTLLLIFFLITFVNSFRSSINYHLYYTFCYLVVFSISLNNLNKRYVNFFSFLVLIVFLANNNFLKSYFFITNDRNIKIFERKNLMVDVCKEFKFDIKSKRYDGTLFYFKYWHKRFDNKSINSLCKELGV